jgi:hypothetical protein
MTDDFAIIVRGISHEVHEIKNCFKEYSQHIIFSTWRGSECNFDSNDKVVFSEKPIIDGPSASYILQRTTARAGLELAEKLNYKNAILIRFDTLFNPANKVIELFDFNKLNFLCWHNHAGGYLVDYIMAGKIEHLKTLWSTFGTYPSKIPEIMITSKYMHELSDKVEVKFILNELNSEREIFWKKYNKMLSRYNLSREFTSMNDGISFSDREKFLNYIK